MFSFYFFAALCMCSGVAPNYTPTAKSYDVGNSPVLIDPDPSSSNLQDASNSKVLMVKMKESGVDALPVLDTSTEVPLDSKMAASIVSIARSSDLKSWVPNEANSPLSRIGKFSKPTDNSPLKTNIEAMTTTEQIIGPILPYSAVCFVMASLVVMPICNILLRLLRIKNRNVIVSCLTSFLLIGLVLVLTLIAYTQEIYSSPNDLTPVTTILQGPLGTCWLLATSVSFFLGSFGPILLCCRRCRFFPFIARFSGDTGVVLAYIAEYAYGFTKTLNSEGEAMFLVQLDNKDILISAFTYLLIKEMLDYVFPRPFNNAAAVAPDPNGNLLPSTPYFDPNELTEILITGSKDIGTPQRRIRIPRRPLKPADQPPSDNADLHLYSTDLESKVSTLPATQATIPNISPPESPSSTSRPPSSISCCDQTATPPNLDTWSRPPAPLHKSSSLRDLRFKSYSWPILYTPPSLSNNLNRPASPCSPRSSTPPSSSPSTCSSCQTHTPPTSACTSRSHLQRSSPCSTSTLDAVSVSPLRDTSRSRLGSWLLSTGRGDPSNETAEKSKSSSSCHSNNTSVSGVSCSYRHASAPHPSVIYGYFIQQTENYHSTRRITVPPGPETYYDPEYWSEMNEDSLLASFKREFRSVTPPRLPRRRSVSLRYPRRRSKHFKCPPV